MSQQKIKITSTKQLTDAEVEPIIAFCEANRGAAARLVELFNKGLKKPVIRRTIVRWLEKLPEKRTEPLYGAGIRLKAVFEQLKSEFSARENKD